VPDQQAIVGGPSVMWSPPMRAFRMRGILRRPRARIEVTPPQFNPPYPFAAIVQPRRPRLRRRVVTKSGTIPPQFNPPFPFAEVHQSRSPRGFLRRKSKPIETVQFQQLIVGPQALPATLQRQTRTVRGAYRRRKVMPVEAVPKQLNPPYPFATIRQPRPPRGFRRRVVTKAETVRTQINPPYPTSEIVQPRRLRGLLRRKGRIAQTVQDQQTIADDFIPEVRIF
jgi:hypothetical protein